jgi:hypothetical protein
MLHERIGPGEPLGGIAGGEDRHRPSGGRIGEGTDHEKLPGPTELLPERAMRFDVLGHLGAKVVAGFVEEDVFPGPPSFPRLASVVDGVTPL